MGEVVPSGPLMVSVSTASRPVATATETARRPAPSTGMSRRAPTVAEVAGRRGRGSGPTQDTSGAGTGRRGAPAAGHTRRRGRNRWRDATSRRRLRWPMGLVDLLAGHPPATPHAEALAQAEHGVAVYWRPGARTAAGCGWRCARTRDGSPGSTSGRTTRAALRGERQRRQRDRAHRRHRRHRAHQPGPRAGQGGPRRRADPAHSSRRAASITVVSRSRSSSSSPTSMPSRAMTAGGIRSALLAQAPPGRGERDRHGALVVGVAAPGHQATRPRGA